MDIRQRSGRGFGWPGAAALWLAAAAAGAATTINTPNQYAYGANVGWLNARGDVTRGASIGQYFCTGYVWSANCGWIGLGNGPTNGWRYVNESATDWGVNHDGAGNLWGYAYGANVGWIVFEQTNGCPRIDLRTGNFSGCAWGANVGWIGLSNAQAFVETDAFATGPDTDSDGLPDAWELSHAGNLHVFSGGTNDWDRDGATDTEEYGADTDPNDDNERFRIASYDAGTRILQWTTRPTRLYRVEDTNQMPGGVSGDWWGAAGLLLGPYASSPHEVILPGIIASTHVYRVKAVLPPVE
ncbi:MAG: hypothetical protein AB7V14_03730 [Kiritimatiellia bacterium]